MDGGDLWPHVESGYGRGALQTPNAHCAAVKAAVGKKIRRLQGHVGSTPARGTTFSWGLILIPVPSPARGRHEPCDLIRIRYFHANRHFSIVCAESRLDLIHSRIVMQIEKSIDLHHV